MCEYHGKFTLYHVDLYRLGSPEELEMIGIREIIYGPGVTVIEWAEKADDLLPDHTLQLEISLHVESPHGSLSSLNGGIGVHSSDGSRDKIPESPPESPLNTPRKIRVAPYQRLNHR